MQSLLNTADVARLLGIAEITVRKWVAKGELPHLKLGRRTLFDPAQLQEWLETKRVAAAESDHHRRSEDSHDR